MTQYLILLPIFPIWVVDHHWFCQVSERLCDVGAALEALVSGRLPAVASPPCFASPALPPPPSLPGVPTCIYEYPTTGSPTPPCLPVNKITGTWMICEPGRQTNGLCSNILKSTFNLNTDTHQLCGTSGVTLCIRVGGSP